MPARWMARRFKDTLPADAGNPNVQCRCGRTVSADQLLDVTALPAALRGEATHLCDGCTQRMIRIGRIAREDFARLVGAPDDVITAAHTYALAHDPIRKTMPVIPLPTDPPSTTSS